jgi:hypothetical protein
MSIGDEYLVEFNREVDPYNFENYPNLGNYILMVNTSGKGTGWAVNKFIVKLNKSIEFSCLIPLDETQCFSCPVNSIMSAK